MCKALNSIADKSAVWFVLWLAAYATNLGGFADFYGEGVTAFAALLSLSALYGVATHLFDRLKLRRVSSAVDGGARLFDTGRRKQGANN
jgi:hypothetical protein